MDTVTSCLGTMPTIRARSGISTISISHLPAPVGRSVARSLLTRGRCLGRTGTTMNGNDGTPRSLCLTTYNDYRNIGNCNRPSTHCTPVINLDDVHHSRPSTLIGVVLRKMRNTAGASPVVPKFSSRLGDRRVTNVTGCMQIGFNNLTDDGIDTSSISRLASNGRPISTGFSTASFVSSEAIPLVWPDALSHIN